MAFWHVLTYGAHIGRFFIAFCPIFTDGAIKADCDGIFPFFPVGADFDGIFHFCLKGWVHLSKGPKGRDYILVVIIGLTLV